jgi:hypothetical protein
MLDLLLKGARVPGQSETREIGIRDGRIAEPEAEARQVVASAALWSRRPWSSRIFISIVSSRSASRAIT